MLSSNALSNVTRANGSFVSSSDSYSVIVYSSPKNTRFIPVALAASSVLRGITANSVEPTCPVTRPTLCTPDCVPNVAMAVPSGVSLILNEPAPNPAVII